MLSVIVFSKHRPLQLQAYLESLLYYSDLEERSIYVFYKETGGISYWELIKKYPKVNWIEETNFLSDLKNIFKYVKPYVLWGCDDVFYKSIFDLKICIKALSEKPELFGFSLRLGRNIQPYPELINQKDFLMWDWTRVELPHQSYEAGISDWAYPWEVSGSIYRKSDISEFLKLSNQPVNPNYLESNVADYCNRTKLSQNRKYLACFEQSKCLTLTINRVQETHKNAFWTTKKTDVDSLFRFFQSGYRLNWKKYQNCQNPSVHVGSDYFELESEKLEGKSVPKISVIIPCYNQGRYLYEALESVVKQTYQNFEVIIVNDGSTDNTQEVAEEFIRIHPQYQIKLIAQANSGQPAIPRNRGISEAKGEYILPLDADDLIESNHARRMPEFIRN